MTGIVQIKIALNQMDEVTQQNSALVEENAATAKLLEQQAGDMDERIAIFKIEAVEPPHQIKAPPPEMHRERAVAARKQRAAATARKHDSERAEF